MRTCDAHHVTRPLRESEMVAPALRSMLLLALLLAGAARAIL
jgi:hypothetical protein